MSKDMFLLDELRSSAVWIWVLVIQMLIYDGSTLEMHYTLFPGPENQLQFHQTTIFDGGAILHCSSPTLRDEPRQRWLSEAFTPEQLRIRHDTCRSQFYDHQSWFQQISTQINNTAEVLQRRYGCADGSGVDKWGINGEDFLTFNPQTLRWSPDTELANPVAAEWNQHTVRNHVSSNRIKAMCQHDTNLFERKRGAKAVRDTDMEVHVFAKSIAEHSSTSLWCHVTGSDLSGVRIQLTKDGVPLDSGVKLIGPRPNGDGTNQMRVWVELRLTDMERYECQVQRGTESKHVQLDGVLCGHSTHCQPPQGHLKVDPHSTTPPSVWAMAFILLMLVGLLRRTLGQMQRKGYRDKGWRMRDEQVRTYLLIAESQRGFELRVALEDEFYGSNPPTGRGN